MRRGLAAAGEQQARALSVRRGGTATLIGLNRSAWALVAACGPSDWHRDETRRSVQANVGKSRFPTGINLRPELKDGKRLFGADERRRKSHAKTDPKHGSRRRLRFHQSGYR